MLDYLDISNITSRTTFKSCTAIAVSAE